MSKFQIREDAFGTFRVYRHSAFLGVFHWWIDVGGDYGKLEEAEERVRFLIKRSQKEKVVKDITSLD